MERVKSGKRLTPEELMVLMLDLVYNEVREARREILEQITLTNKRIDETNKRIDKVYEDLSRKIEETNRRVDRVYEELLRKIEEVRAELSKKIDETNKRIDELYKLVTGVRGNAVRQE